MVRCNGTCFNCQIYCPPGCYGQEISAGKRKEREYGKNISRTNPDMSASHRLRKGKPTAFKAKRRTPGSRKTVIKIVVPPRKLDRMAKYFEEVNSNNADTSNILVKQKPKNNVTVTSPGPYQTHLPVPVCSTHPDPEMSAKSGPTYRRMGTQEGSHVTKIWTFQPIGATITPCGRNMTEGSHFEEF